MARLFITPREIDFINDTAKELVKDVIGQKIYYFQISEIKTNVHDVYEEAPEKIFETPIAIDALVKYEPQAIKTDRFGSEEYYTIEAYIQKRDLIEKGIKILEGDFFSYGTVFFEVVTAPDSKDIFGEIEYKSFITVRGKQSRAGQFVTRVFGPTSEEYTDSDSVQETFVQQRGFKENRLGETEDRRNLRQKGILTEPISRPREVSRRGIPGKSGSSFYDDE